MGDPKKGRNAFSHLDEGGRARMVNVSAKPVTRRRAVAEGTVRMNGDTLRAIRRQEIEKGDVLTVARLAAIGGAKRTAEIVPLCHPLPLDSVEVEIHEEESVPGLRVRVAASAESRTGVEMEAMCGVSAALLSIYDMCKGTERGISLEQVRLLEKSGGSSGDWRR